jgi:Transcriptional regulator, AbiEi antitoxin/Protein of unknown function (DUF559)
MTSKRNRTGEGEELVAEEGRRGKIDQELADLADEQSGLASLAQVEDRGLGARGASHRAASGRLHRVHRGVYAVGHRSIGRAGALRAAVLACGEGAVVSHGTAAAMWGLWNRWPVLVDVIVPCEAGRKIDGIRAHRCRYPHPEEVTMRGGVPCTTPARTLVDNAGTYGRPRLQRFVEEALVRKLLDFGALDLAMHRAKGRRGIRALDAIAERWRMPSGEAPDVRSVFEARILPPLVAIGFDWPECNRTLKIGGEKFIADFYWPQQRLLVETDGEATHGTPVAFSGDRRRDQVLMSEGYRATRVTWAHMRDELTETIRRIRKTLERGSSELSG